MHRDFARHVAGLALTGTLLILAAVAWTNPAKPTARIVQVHAIVSPKSAVAKQADEAPLLARRLPLERTARFVVADALIEQARTRLVAIEADPAEKRRVVGMSIDLADDAPLVWQRTTLDDGAVSWRTRIESPDAHYLRPFLTGIVEDAEGELWIYGDDGPARRVAPTASQDPEAFWGPAIFGEALTLEFIADGDAEPDIDVARVSHGFKDFLGAPKLAGTCNLDVNCYSEFADIKSGIATYLISQGSGDFVCTGTLLNDLDGTLQPWFLTANHCVGSNSGASSLLAFWGYETDGCNGTPVDRNSRPTSAGATLLYTETVAAGTDVSFLLLDEDPPDGTTYLGWTTDSPDIGDGGLSVIHHPQGDYKRIAFGSKIPVQDINGLSTNPDNFHFVHYVEGDSDPGALGTTEPGSSGASLLNDDHQVIGQLYGGTASCAEPDAPDIYGKFAISFTNGVGEYLTNGTLPTTTTVTTPVSPGDGDDDDDKFRSNDSGGDSACGC